MPPPQPSPNSSNNDAGKQLLQELEALSQALYRAGHSHRGSPPPRKDAGSPFVAKRDAIPARGGSSFLGAQAGKSGPHSRSGQNSKSSEGGGVAGMSRFALQRRHSTSSVQVGSLDQGESGDVRTRFSASVPRPSAAARDSEKKVETRARSDRRGAQLWHSQSLDTEFAEMEDVVESHEDFDDDSTKNWDVAEEKKGFWKWKPFRALAHIGQQRFHVIFSVNIHSIEGLPAPMNGLRLSVHWRRKEEGVQTTPSRVFQGVAKFDEILRQRCTVYGSKNPNHGMKYEAKFFTLSVVALDADELEFGDHRLDLSRLLPESIGGAENIDRPGSWTTSFELSGKAKGGSLAVTFGYDIVHHEVQLQEEDVGDSSARFASATRSTLEFESLPNSAHGSPLTRSSNTPISPTHSEPVAVLENTFGLDHLNLNDGGGETISSQTSSLAGLDNGLTNLFQFKPTLKFFPQDDPLPSQNPLNQSQEHLGLQDAGYRDQDDGSARFEDVAEFTVEETGVEVGSLSGDPIKVMKDGGDSVSVEQSSGISFQEGEDEQKGAFLSSGKQQGFYEPEGEEGGGGFEARLGFNQLQMDQTEEGESEDRRFLKSSTYEDLNRQLAVPDGSSEAKAGDDFQDCEADFDEEVDLVAGEFLNMLEEVENFPVDSHSEPDSPRAVLLKKFEQEELLGGGLGVTINNMSNSQLGETNQEQFIGKMDAREMVEKSSSSWEAEGDLELASIMEAAESELQKANQTMRSKARAKMLEDAETEALMQQWGLNEKAFESLPRKPARGKTAVMEALEPPPLARGLGNVINMRDGGSLRSMSPTHFHKSKTNGRLVMQVSRPVVVPAGTGSSAMDILKNLASFGVENMAMQAMLAMPLEDITGKTAEDLAVEVPQIQQPGHMGTSSFHSRNRLGSEYGPVSGGRKRVVTEMKSTRTLGDLPTQSGPARNNMAGAFDDCASLEDLAPLAMQSIEALALDGLKIQTDLAEEEAPSYLDAAAWGTLEDLKKREAGGMGTREGVAGMHFFDGMPVVEERSKGADGALSMAISLEEWSRLDAGVFDDEEINAKTKAILAAHNANHSNLMVAYKDKNEKGGVHNRGSQGHAGRWGHMGNTLMIAMLVQLRDPFRNYEPVGTPMMALVQAERFMVPPKPKLGKRVSSEGNSEEVEDSEEVVKQKQEPPPEAPQEPPQFKITDVHLTGLKTSEDEKKKGWGNQKQQQSGSRWLIGHGMAKNPKHPLLKSKPVPAKTKVKPGDTLWSISSRVHGTGEKWKEVAALNPHIRNPDVIFANDTIRTR